VSFSTGNVKQSRKKKGLKIWKRKKEKYGKENEGEGEGMHAFF
jgi:hypothetical protein